MRLPFISSKTPLVKHLPLILFAACFLFYAFTASPTIYPRDNAEFIVAVKTLGIPHPPAYPLYIILGKIFTLIIPLGSFAWQVNLMSGFFAALSVVLVFLILKRLTDNIPVALITALSLAFSHLFWYYSDIADVFTLHAFWLLLIIYLLLKWQEKLQNNQGADKLLFITAFLFGLGFGNHHTLILLLPAILYFIWLTDKKIFYSKKIIYLLLVSLAGLLLIYSFVIIRSQADPFLDWGNPETLSGLLAVFLRQEFGTVFLSKNFVEGWSINNIFNHSLQYFYSLTKQFHAWGIIVALVGLIYLALKKRLYFNFTVLAFLFLGPVIIFLISNIPLDPNVAFVTEKFYLASFIIFSFWLGFGLYLIIKLANQWLKNLKHLDVSKVLIAVLILILPLYSLISNWRDNNLHSYYLDHQYVTDILASLEQNAILITPNDSIIFGIWYVQQVEKLRPDVIVIQTVPSEITHQQIRQRYPHLFSGPITNDKIFAKLTFPSLAQKTSLGQLLEEIILKNIDSRPIYFSVGDPALTSNFTNFLIPQGLVYRLTTKPSDYTPEKMLLTLNSFHQRYSSHDEYKITDQSHFLEQEIFLRYAITYNDLGFYFLSQQDYDTAYQLFLKSLSINPGVPIIENNINLIFQIQNLLAQLEKNPNDTQLKTALAQSYYAARQFDQSAKLLEEMIKKEPENAVLYNNYGLALMGFKQWEEAKNNFQKALELDQTLASAQTSLNFINYLLAD
ncbi:MAG: hypothetical protein A3J62_04245 [Candidatus Buchananbacteria bacterium RIFCSPHIGHO2_02_FULL_38_8]|uniref:Glycosyltransferase RgtA/B/C/D-like domain-containing protein n=1 Tax=Candidatus Buchananbacteria bacterium RIFCSPHIGHO2_02_FULL_38_8 TaxID=1797538 RepID=A0A1G1Y8C7_9BACT|nr:MAG: hypothetical protein A3J62_04245 [Candidatus Buchananbacteria bacterium RIFCSPHIGHO2_02_FULL_38_8]